MADRDRTFAAGRCRIDGLGCPVERSSYPLGEYMHVAHAFDEQISQLMDDDLMAGYTGARVGEDHAKPAFLDAIETLEDDGRDDVAEDARDVARDLGWLD